MMLFRSRLAFVLLSVVYALLIWPQEKSKPQQERNASSVSDEYDVHAAVLSQLNIDRKGRHLMIGDVTSSFSCTPSESNGLVVAECSGMRLKQQSPREALQHCCSPFMGILDSTLADFELRNDKGSPLKPLFPLQGEYILYGNEHPDGPPKSWGAPDFAVYLSRVGFSEDKSQALVFVSAISWTDQRLSGGQYVLLQRTEKSWKIKAKAKTWEMD